MLSNTDITKYGFRLKNSIIPEEFNYLREHFSDLQLTILSNRLDLTKASKEDLEDYIYNKLDVYKDLYKLKDVDIAGKLIAEHIANNKRICLVTDCDSDGINSAVVLYKCLKEIMAVSEDNIIVVINRRKYGNGVNNTLVEQIRELNNKTKIDLIITADHGSADENRYIKLKEFIPKIIVTDHHQIDYNNYPKHADVFVNNQREDSEYSKNVSGCCIAFLTMVATYIVLYDKKTDLVNTFRSVLPNVAISTISDVMSLAEPFNRHIVNIGLQELNSFRNRAWLVLRKVLDIPGGVSVKDIGFKVSPLINTANRMDAVDLAYKLLSTNKPEEATLYSERLSDLNDVRKLAVKASLKEARDKILNTEYKFSNVVMLSTKLAIAGVVAPALGGFNRLPTVCFTEHPLEDNILVGSGREVLLGFDILSVLRKIEEEDDSVYLRVDGVCKYGGHEGAAGCSIPKDKIEDFKALFDKHAGNQLQTMKSDNTMEIDAIIPDKIVNTSLAMDILGCGPYGKNWEEPKLLSEFTIVNIIILGNMARILLAKSNGDIVEGMHYFNTPDEYDVSNIKQMLRRDDKVVVVYNYNILSYRGVYSNTLNILSIKRM